MHPDPQSADKAPNQTVIELLRSPYSSVDGARQGLAALEQYFWDRHDRRAVFALAYRDMTGEVKRRLDERWFLDNEWVDRLVIAFANFYRQALYDFERGSFRTVPRAWIIAFETSRQDRTVLPQDLVLGINAHINRDLPLALYAVTIDPERDKHYHDHMAINTVLATLTDVIQDRMVELYGPAIHLVDEALGRLDEQIAGFTLTKAREQCWTAAVELAAARDERARAAIIRRLDRRAAALAEVIRAPALPAPLLLDVMAHLERVTPWWQHMAPVTGRPAPSMPAPVSLPQAGTLEELAARLRDLPTGHAG
jgi:hypothetical protein